MELEPWEAFLDVFVREQAAVPQEPPVTAAVGGVGGDSGR